MAAEENRKKTGTIFMGQREASVEQLNAMQEPLRKERLQKEQTEDYMERVRARAADRAREILGAAYAERQKVLEEARAEIQAQKRQATEECARIKAEGEILRKNAQKELAKASEELAEAERIRAEAHETGYQAGLDSASEEVYKYRTELGHSVATVLRALDQEKKNIMELWREDLSELVRCAVQAGTGYILEKEHEAILRSLVFQALDMLETHGSITLRVNPEDEDKIGDLFTSVRERFPDLRQWIVNGDAQIERGSLIAESGSGSVDMKRANFREMVENIICHLGLPEQAVMPAQTNEVRDIVEREVAHITSLTPELVETLSGSEPEEPEVVEEVAEDVSTILEAGEDTAEPETEEGGERVTDEAWEDLEAEIEDSLEAQEMGQKLVQEGEMADQEMDQEAPFAGEVGDQDEIGPEVEEEAGPKLFDEDNNGESLEDLEDELFPVDEESEQVTAIEPPFEAPETPEPPLPEQPDPRTLAEGGFL